jgi:hypothetical protein
MLELISTVPYQSPGSFDDAKRCTVSRSNKCDCKEAGEMAHVVVQPGGMLVLLSALSALLCGTAHAERLVSADGVMVGHMLQLQYKAHSSIK